MELQRLLVTCVSIFALRSPYCQKVEGHVCILEEKNDISTGQLRWSVPKTERCDCQAVVAPPRHHIKSCVKRSDKHNSRELWFIDDIAPLLDRKNWVKETLDVLLKRYDCSSYITDVKIQGSTSSKDVVSYNTQTSTSGEGVTTSNTQSLTSSESATKSNFKASTSSEGVTTTINQASTGSEYATMTSTQASTSNEVATMTDIQASTSSEGVTTTNTQASTSSEGATMTDIQASTSSEDVTMTSTQALTSGEGVTMTTTKASTSHSEGVTMTNTKASTSHSEGVTMTNTKASPSSEGVTMTNIQPSTSKGLISSAAQSCNEKLGLENGDISDSNITASNYFPQFPPWKGRLNGHSFWGCLPSVCTSEFSTWIQADLGYQTWISGVITQGGMNEDWVTEIKVSTFVAKGGDEVFVKNLSGEPKVFPANTDVATPVVSTFPQPVYARIVRITCVSKNQYNWNMRFEALGCKT